MLLRRRSFGYGSFLWSIHILCFPAHLTTPHHSHLSSGLLFGRGGASWSSHKKGAYIHNWPRHQLLFIFHFFEQTNSCFFSKNVNKTLLYYYNWPPPKLCDLCHHSSLKRVFPSVFFSRNILLTNLLANNHNSMCRNKWEKMERWKIYTCEHRVYKWRVL